MTRDDLVEAGWQALKRDDMEDWAMGAWVLVERVVDTVEPLIRADDRELGAALNEALLRDLRADLRAKIEVLPGNDPFQSPERRDAYEYAIKDVLNLIDGDE